MTYVSVAPPFSCWVERSKPRYSGPDEEDMIIPNGPKVTPKLLKCSGSNKENRADLLTFVQEEHFQPGGGFSEEDIVTRASHGRVL
jgi:hypothetical protein